jgi:thymidylate synthase (FAD)
MSVKFIHITPDAEKLIAYCARVSSDNQDNPNYEKLIQYCIKHNHWSVLEMANMCLEITTTRAISPQILRHRSFSFQEFSQRYAQATSVIVTEARRQDIKNRQNSIDDLSPEVKGFFELAQNEVWELSKGLYDEAISLGICKESARGLLPLNTETKLYMNGSLRSWAHYINVRTDQSTQQEHRWIASECKRIFTEQLPIIAKAMWGNAV